MVTIIKAIPPGQDDLGDDEALWRYTKLSTFFQLMKGVAFIPSLQHLQKGDAKENWLPAKSPASVYQALSRHQEFREAHPFLVSVMTQLEKSKFGNGKSPSDKEILTAIWLRELARRRCVWCWHRATSESMALWKIYGEQGVAVRSSLRRIRDGLRFKTSIDILAGPVDYRPANFRTQAFTQSAFLFRPFFFKNDAYKYEAEVRIVFRVTTKESQRFLVSIYPRKLIDRVVLSPYIPSSEGYFLTELIKRKLNIDNVSHSPGLLQDRFRSNFVDSISYRIAKLPTQLQPETGLPKILDNL